MPSALDLLDNIEPAAIVETVNIRGTEFPVRGMSIREWAAILKRFPSLDDDAPDTPAPLGRRVDSIMDNLEIATAVIAIGFGQPGDKEIEAKIEAKFSNEERQTLFDAVIRLTRGDAGPLPAAAERPNPEPENPGKAAALASSSSSTSSSAADTTAPM